MVHIHCEVKGIKLIHRTRSFNRKFVERVPHCVDLNGIWLPFFHGDLHKLLILLRVGVFRVHRAAVLILLHGPDTRAVVLHRRSPSLRVADGIDTQIQATLERIKTTSVRSNNVRRHVAFDRNQHLVE